VPGRLNGQMDRRALTSTSSSFASAAPIRKTPLSGGASPSNTEVLNRAVQVFDTIEFLRTWQFGGGGR
jgi:hypothetical protein